jgi:hypothetical protein
MLSPASFFEENTSPIFAIQADLVDPSEHYRIIDLAVARFSHIDLVVQATAASLLGGSFSFNCGQAPAPIMMIRSTIA